MRKIYILDTSVLAHDSNALTAFNGNDVILPIVILEELDKLKNGYNTVSANARIVIRKLDDYSNQGEIFNGITIENDIKLIIDTKSYRGIGQDKDYGDNKILACAKNYSDQKDRRVVLVSRDINLRVRAKALGIEAEDYRKDTVARNKEELYTGRLEVKVPGGEVDEFYLKNRLELSDEFIQEHGVLNNQFITLVDEEDLEKIAFGRFHSDGLLKPIATHRNVFGLAPRNREQGFVLDLLMDPNIKLITITGAAGTGKSLISLAAALEQILHKKTYDKLYIAKSLTTIGPSPGALPGGLMEKLNPFLGSLMDSINVLFTSKKNSGKENERKQSRRSSREDEFVFDDPYLSLLVENKTIQIDALAYIRGRSIPNSIMFFDELQNQTSETVKAALTRAGDNTKIICCGDIEQCDQANLNTFNNGLTYLVEKFKGQKIYGHISLVQGERSELATLASKLL